MTRNKLPCILAGFFIVSQASAQIKPDALKDYNGGNYEKAIEICLQELSSSQANADSYVVLCWSLVKKGKYPEALLYAQKARSIAKSDVRITEIFGETLYYSGRNEEALKLFQEYVLQAPEGARIGMVFWLTGEIYIRYGRFQHADIALTTACQYEPTNGLYWTRLAYAREQAKEMKSAQEAYMRALAINPQNNDARLGKERLGRLGYN